MTDQPTTEKTGFADMHEHGGTVRSAYRQRIDALEAANRQRIDDEDSYPEDSTLESVDTELSEEARFVANPDVRKEVTSEEEFAAGLEDGEDDLVETETPDVEDPDGGTSEEEAEEDDLPKESWKRDDIVQYLVDHKVIESADDVDGQTKAQLIDNFVDSNA